MGNAVNYYQDIDFMIHYDKCQQEFVNSNTLFDTQHITFPLSTKAMAIIDSKGKRVKLAGGNWSGGHAARHCISGLDKQPLDKMCRDIRDKFHMNCVRLTFSLELFEKNNIIPKELLKANKYLIGKTASQIFKITIDNLTQNGIMVILNNHTSKSQWCCSTSDGDGLWFTKEYSQQIFFKRMEQLAKQYKDNPLVIGMDIRNQVRASHLGQPTWGNGSKFDWKKAAEIAGNRVHQYAPYWLIIIGGLDYQLDLTPILQHPIKLNQQNKLIYSGHLYNFSWGPPFIQSFQSQQSFRQKLFNSQLFVRGIKGRQTPFILGEFGNNVRDTYWIYLIKYMKELDLDWIYWCLDGYKCDNQQDQTYGIWNYNFTSQRHPEMLEDLQDIARPKDRM